MLSQEGVFNYPHSTPQKWCGWLFYDLDENKIVCYYDYDAWGNYSIEGNEDLGELNPFRYRGYYYDEETNLYYLQTRYYDPETGRFISQDSVEYLDPEHINGLNLYAYCGNNPVMGVDPNGTSWSSFWSGVKNFFTVTVPHAIGSAVMWVNNNIVQPTINFVSNNWDIILGAALVVGGIALSIVTFGATTVVAGVICGAVLGAAFGALSAYSRGENIVAGLCTGLLVGATGGVNPFTAMLTATGMSLISDRVNGKTASGKSVIQAFANGMVAGVLAAGSNAFANAIFKGAEEIVKNVACFVSAFIFAGYSFVTDTLSGLFWRKH